jgi:hypothetical protein
MNVEDLFDQVTDQLESIVAGLTLTIPVLFEMNHRIRTAPYNPCFHEIVYPGTTIPIFTKEQGYELEDAFANVLTAEEELERKEMILQHGGGVIPEELKEMAKKIGEIEREAFGLVDGDTFSPDSWFDSFKRFLHKTLPELAKQIKEMGETTGLTMLETTFPDLKGVVTIPIPVPPFVIPIPYNIPNKLILPALSSFLDVLRLTVSVVPFTGTIASLPITILLSLIEIGKGDLYTALISLFGLIGTGGIFIGILMKLGLGSIILLEPALNQIPDELLDAGYRAGKAAIFSFFLKLFATVSPDVIRLPLTTFTETMKQASRVFNKGVDTVSKTVSKSTKDKVHLEMGQIAVDQIPSFMDILSIQRLLQNPMFLTYPGIIDLIEDFRTTPPFALIIDFLNVPRKESPEYQQMLEETKGITIPSVFTPHLMVQDPSTGEYVDINDIKKADKGLFESVGDLAKSKMPNLPSSPMNMLKDAVPNPGDMVKGLVPNLSNMDEDPSNMVKGMVPNPGNMVKGMVPNLSNMAEDPSNMVKGMVPNPSDMVKGMVPNPSNMARKAGLPGSLSNVAGKAGLPTSPLDQVNKAKRQLSSAMGNTRKSFTPTTIRKSKRMTRRKSRKVLMKE